MNYTNSKDYIRLLNLLRFNVNFSSFADCELYDQSPSYIVEKFEFHTGLQSCEFAKTPERLLYTPNNLENFIHIYCKRWGRVENDVLRHIIYLKTCENLHLLRIVENFEILYGPIKIIKCEESYLHAKIEADFLPTILDINEKNLKVIIRDWNLDKMRYGNSFSVSLKTMKPLSPKAINRFQYKACLFAEVSNHQPRR